jgi:hypothetical protein
MKNSFLLVTTFLIAATTSAQRRNNQDSLAKESEKTEVWTPVPKLVTPGTSNSDAPSDAIVLFNGKDVNQLQKENGGAVGWKIDDDGALTVVNRGLAIASYI